MRVELLYFGVLKESLGSAGGSAEVSPGADVATLLKQIEGLGSVGETLLRSLAVAVNREYAALTTVLHDGDEVALLPPVSGGSHAR